MDDPSDAHPIWVTGAGGFIGSAVAAALMDKGERVIGFGQLRKPTRHSELTAFVPGGLAVETLERAVAEFGPPARVFHFAGGSTVGASFADPLRDFESNVASTAYLLDRLRWLAPKAPVVLASSAAVYGDRHQGSISIDAGTRPLSPYGHHKIMAETIGRSFAENFGMRITVLRLFSVYGAGLRKQLLYDLCVRLNNGEDPLMLGGTGGEQRDWCHVEDVANLCAALAPAEPGVPLVFNVGTGAGTDIAAIAAMVASFWGGRSVRFSGNSRPGDPFSLVADKDSLPPGFLPKRSLEAGIRHYVNWFRSDSA